MFRRYVLPYLVYAFFRLWTGSWRKHVVEHPEMLAALAKGEPLVLCFWHGDEVTVLGACWDRHKYSTMTSTSADGTMLNTILNRMGIATSRGSSTRGGVGGLKGLIRLAREGWTPVLAPDGPKGPIHKAKPGIFELSRLLGARIVPAAGVGASEKVFERSWNKAHLPHLFTKVAVVWAEPLPAVTKDDDVRSPELAARLEAALNSAGSEARKLIAKV